MTMGAAALAEGTFRVGVKQDVYGFGYYDEATGEFSGMEIDLGEKLAEAHPSMEKMLEKDFVCQNLPIPLHPAAEKFYQEHKLL